eukprot:7078487-Prorocentrum_lima.AAC.1
MTSSLVGSEMCIRDRMGRECVSGCCHGTGQDAGSRPPPEQQQGLEAVSYTHLTLPTICSV